MVRTRGWSSAALLVAVGCLIGPPVDAQRYVNEAHGFSFEPPRGWVAADPAGQDPAMFLSQISAPGPTALRFICVFEEPDPAGFRASMNVSARSSHVVPEIDQAFLDGIVREMETQTNPPRICEYDVESAELVSIAGQEGAKLIGTVHIPALETSYRCAQYWVRGPSRTFLVTYTCGIEEFPDLEAVFDASIQSFEIRHQSRWVPLGLVGMFAVLLSGMLVAPRFIHRRRGSSELSAPDGEQFTAGLPAEEAPSAQVRTAPASWRCPSCDALNMAGVAECSLCGAAYTEEGEAA